MHVQIEAAKLVCISHRRETMCKREMLIDLFIKQVPEINNREYIADR